MVLGEQNRGKLADGTITEDMGIITVMKQPVTLRLQGDALGTDGISAITLHRGTNLIGVPLKDKRLKRVSDLLSLEGIRGNATAVVVLDTNDGVFKVVARPDDDGDIPITGGQAFLINARAAGTAEITGEAWDNVSGNGIAAPPLRAGILSPVGHIVDGKTPVLAVDGSVVEEVAGIGTGGFRITVKNLSTGASLSTLSGSDTGQPQGISPTNGYSVTFVDAISSRSAQIGDMLQVNVETPSPLIGVQPLRYLVTPADVKASQIHLPELIAYEIPTETKLLANYPNPFNPETWIPYRLAEDAAVALTIYDMTGTVIRTLKVGHQSAAVYESRDKAIYWDGRNDFGERVASGIYFYHLQAGDFQSTRKMISIK